MRRIALIALTLLLAAGTLAATASSEDERTYFIEVDNAFGIVNGSEVKVAGVRQGTVEETLINDDKKAVLRVKLSGPLAELGDETICSLEPQSLIAEYFVDCSSKGEALEPAQGTDTERKNEPDIPVEQTRQTVQQDLALSALRVPYKQRLRLILNEFGTALAGNPEELNAAIRRGAPALTAAKKLTKILGDQNTIIRRLNVDSDKIFAELEDNRRDVRQFVLDARDTAAASAERRDDLSTNFLLLDDFLNELRPTMVRLNEFALAQTPLLRNLQDSAPGLAELSRDLPDFNTATTRSLTTLGDASDVGRRALRKGRDEIDQLRRTSRDSFSAANYLAAFLTDIDDPSRHVAEDARAAERTGRDAPTGYTGLEGLLNYLYYQAGAINQFDQISHLLHFSIFEVESGPCSSYNATQEVPSEDGGTTTDFNEIDRCVAWLGPNQPGINDPVDLPKYDPAVCPEGSTDTSICDPDGASGASAKLERRAEGATAARGSGARGARKANRGGGNSGNGPGAGSAGGSLGELPDVLENLPGGADGVEELRKGVRGAGSNGEGPSPGATRDLLGFLLDD